MTQTSKPRKLTPAQTERLIQVAGFGWSPVDGTRRALALRDLIDHKDRLTAAGREALWGAAHVEALAMNAS